MSVTHPAFSVGEVRPPERVQQTDLAATLAVGLGLPIPQRSVGRFLFPVVQGRAMREQLRLLHLNAVQLSRLLHASSPAYERGASWPSSGRLGPVRLVLTAADYATALQVWTAGLGLPHRAQLERESRRWLLVRWQGPGRKHVADSG